MESLFALPCIAIAFTNGTSGVVPGFTSGFILAIGDFNKSVFPSCVFSYAYVYLILYIYIYVYIYIYCFFLFQWCFVFRLMCVSFSVNRCRVRCASQLLLLE